MEVSFEVDKVIKYAIYNTVFFSSGGDDALMRLSLIKQIIKDVNLMGISVSAKYTQIFWESRMCPICPELFPVSIHNHLTHNW